MKVQPLITHRFPIEHAPGAYKLISEGKEPYIGVLLTYPMVDHRPVSAATIWLKGNRQTLDSDGRLPPVSGRPTGVGFIGAGNFAKGNLLPIIRRLKGVSLQGIAALPAPVPVTMATNSGSNTVRPITMNCSTTLASTPSISLRVIIPMLSSLLKRCAPANTLSLKNPSASTKNNSKKYSLFTTK